jgi:hypothetical protein
MKSFRFRDSKLIERWEIIDIFSVPKELAMRQGYNRITSFAKDETWFKPDQQLRKYLVTRA